MTDVMDHARWMKFTYKGAMSVRSTQLKAIDAALLRYHAAKTPANMDALRTAVMTWIGKEGANWKSSVRNRYHAVDDLYRQVMGIASSTKTGAEMVALSHVRDESRAIVTDLFRGKRLIWRSGFAGKLANQKWSFRISTASVARHSDQLSGGAIRRAPQQMDRAIANANGGGSNRATTLARNLVKEIVPSNLEHEVMSALAEVLPTFMTDLAASLTPFLGVFTTAAGVVVSSGKLVRTEYRLEQSRMHQERSLAVQEPAKAIDGLIRMLERERTSDAFDVTRGLAECGGKLAGVLADGGTVTNAAIGMASAVLRLMNILRIVVRDVQERREANLLMQRVRIDVSLFEACPVAGAYMICCVPTSVMLNSVFDRFWQSGFRGDVERTAQRHIVPLRNQARRLVKEHRFVITELVNFPGVLEVNKKKLKAMIKQTGKSGMTGFGCEDDVVADDAG